jgi:hypothetical protein
MKVYFIQPSGGEEWIETPKRTIKFLRDKGYNLNLDDRGYAVFITIETDDV